MKFAALVVIGDQKGTIGVGQGKAAEVPDAIRKAIEDAKKNLVTISLKGSSIPHETIGEFLKSFSVVDAAASVTPWTSSMT